MVFRRAVFFCQHFLVGGDAEAGIADARECLLKLEKLWSATDENSEIYKINHSQGRTERVSMETILSLMNMISAEKQLFRSLVTAEADFLEHRQRFAVWNRTQMSEVDTPLTVLTWQETGKISETGHGD